MTSTCYQSRQTSCQSLHVVHLQPCPYCRGAFRTLRIHFMETNTCLRIHSMQIKGVCKIMLFSSIQKSGAEINTEHYDYLYALITCMTMFRGSWESRAYIKFLDIQNGNTKRSQLLVNDLCIYFPCTQVSLAEINMAYVTHKNSAVTSGRNCIGSNLIYYVSLLRIIITISCYQLSTKGRDR
jgi:hypothetical protein